MDILAIIISTLMAVVSPAGVVVDRLAADALRGQVAEAEAIHVRIDNVPNYQIASGRVNQAQVAARGLYPRQLPDLRIAAIDLETDVLDVDLAALQRGQLKLDHPAQAALRLRLNASDLNAFLASPNVQTWLSTLKFSLPGESDREQERYGLINPTLTFLDNNRLRLVVDLEDRVLAETISIALETEVGMIQGHRFELIDPRVEIDGEAAPPELFMALAEGASQEFSLRRLEEFGLTARVLALEVRNNELDLALFARLEPTSPFLASDPDREAVPPAP
jgi:hypothetical protein